MAGKQALADRFKLPLIHGISQMRITAINLKFDTLDTPKSIDSMLTIDDHLFFRVLHDGQPTGQPIHTERLGSGSYKCLDGVKIPEDISLIRLNLSVLPLAGIDFNNPPAVKPVPYEIAYWEVKREELENTLEKVMFPNITVQKATITSTNGLPPLKVSFFIIIVPLHSFGATDTLAGSALIGLRQTFEKAYTSALALTESTLKGQPICGLFKHIGDYFCALYRESNAIPDISFAIQAYDRALSLSSPADELNYRFFLQDLGNALLGRYDLAGNIDDGKRSIELLREVVRLAPDDLGVARNLSVALKRHFERTLDVETINEAIKYSQQVVAETDDKDYDKPLIWDNLGEAISARYLHGSAGRTLDDIDAAIAAYEKAVELSPEDNENLPGRLTNLADAFLNRFELTKNPDDLRQSIIVFQKAFKLLGTNDFDAVKRPSYLNALSRIGNAAVNMFYRTGNMEMLNQAVKIHLKAVQHTPRGHASMPFRLGNLGVSLVTRFRCTGKGSDLDSGITAQKKAVDLTPAGDTGLASLLNNLGNAYMSRFERTGNLDDVEEGISAFKKAVSATSENNKDLPGRLSNLGVATQTRFFRLGNLKDLDESITLKQKAILLTPESNPDILPRFGNLGGSLLSRYDLLGNESDLDESISMLRKAADGDYPTIDGQISILTNLSNALSSRFQIKEELKDIDEAIEANRSVVKLAPPGESTSASLHICNLGVSLITRYKKQKDLRDLTEAISCQREASKICPDGYFDKPRQYHNLSAALVQHFELSGDLTDIDEAIKLQKMSIEITPPSHFYEWAVRGQSLGSVYSTRYNKTKDIEDVKKSAAQYQLVALAVSCPPSVRFVCATQWAYNCLSFDPSEAMPAWATALSLLPRVVWVGRTLTDRHAQLKSYSQLSMTAALTAMLNMKFNVAVEWLEQGRGIVWNQLHELRTPLDDLRLVHPELAEELVSVSNALESAGSRTTPSPNPLSTMLEKMSIQTDTQGHHALADKWDDLVSQVRSISGFEEFLRPPIFAKIKNSLPDEGTVVFINVHSAGCDALAIVPGLDDPVLIPLNNFSFQKALRLQNLLRNFLIDNRIRGRSDRAGRVFSRPKTESVFQLVLKELWSDVVKVILDSLGCVPTKTPQRIWWCPTGPLAFLPIHAAGLYERHYIGFGSVISDYVVSSYTPTLHAILISNAATKKPGSISEFKGILVVSQSNTPNLPQLPGTVTECLAVKAECEKANINVEYLEGSAATVEKVVDTMGHFNWVHLAMHASQDTLQPVKSAFHLADGSLELATVIKKPLPLAQFAFLSACETSTGAETLSEEAVHLAGGMLSAGYRGVIASMWSIADEYAPNIAAGVYSRLLDTGNPDSRKAAYALHESVQQLRKTLGDSDAALLCWVPFIHIGL